MVERRPFTKKTLAGSLASRPSGVTLPSASAASVDDSATPNGSDLSRRAGLPRASTRRKTDKAEEHHRAEPPADTGHTPLHRRPADTADGDDEKNRTEAGERQIEKGVGPGPLGVGRGAHTQTAIVAGAIMGRLSTTEGMPDLPRPDAGEPPAPAGAPAPLSGSKRKKSKARDAWITFISRIVAQVVGAIASIVLAVMFLQRSQSSGTPETPAQPAAPQAPAAAAGAAIARRWRFCRWQTSLATSARTTSPTA